MEDISVNFALLIFGYVMVAVYLLSVRSRYAKYSFDECKRSVPLEAEDVKYEPTRSTWSFVLLLAYCGALIAFCKWLGASNHWELTLHAAAGFLLWMNSIHSDFSLVPDSLMFVSYVALLFLIFPGILSRFSQTTCNYYRGNQNHVYLRALPIKFLKSLEKDVPLVEAKRTMQQSIALAFLLIGYLLLINKQTELGVLMASLGFIGCVWGIDWKARFRSRTPQPTC